MQNVIQLHIFGNFWKRWFSRTFQFVINFTSLDILLGIPNYDNSIDVMILNFAILFVKYYINNCKKNGMPTDVFSFLVKLKSHLIIEEYRHIMYNRGLEFATKWSILCDRLWMYSWYLLYPLSYSAPCFTNSVMPKSVWLLCVMCEMWYIMCVK